MPDRAAAKYQLWLPLSATMSCQDRRQASELVGISMPVLPNCVRSAMFSAGEPTELLNDSALLLSLTPGGQPREVQIRLVLAGFTMEPEFWPHTASPTNHISWLSRR